MKIGEIRTIATGLLCGAIVLSSALCYSAETSPLPVGDALTAAAGMSAGRTQVRLSGFGDVADAVAVRELLQCSTLVKELRLEKLSWQSGRPDLGLAVWSLVVEDDAVGLLEAEIAGRAAALESRPLRLSCLHQGNGTIEWSIADEAKAQGPVPAEGLVSATPSVTPATPPRVETVVAPVILSRQLIRPGRGFD